MAILRQLKFIFTLGSAATAALAKADRGTVGGDADDIDATPLPVVIWHGLGDSYSAEGLQAVGALLDGVNPGTFVHYVHIGNTPSADQSATFLGNLTEQVAQVCDELAAHPILSTAPAIDAVGFSQGGQFLRAYVERCNVPPVRNLVTFGAQHNGITRFRDCARADVLCSGAMWLLRTGVWTEFVQSRLVPAQYFRDPAELDNYLEHSNFLADVNNERPLKNQTYRENLASLANLVMYMWENDTTVEPKESAWFGEVVEGEVVPLRARQLYKEDWLGLKALDEKGGLQFRTTPGDHMQLTEELLNKTFGEFFGPWKKSTGDAARPVRVELENGDL